MKRGFMGAPDQILFGRSEFRQSKVLLCKTLVRTLCGAAVLRRKATGVIPVSAAFPYCGISSIVKASIISPVPMKRGFMGAPDQILFGRSEFRQSKVLPCKTLVRTSCGAAVLRRKATGVIPVSAAFPYCGISSIVKASIISPSLISLNFSMVMPHS